MKPDQSGDAAASDRKSMPLPRCAPNFRDLGGLPAEGGRMVRHGVVYRSGALHDIDDADLEILGTLGIRVCMDLRSRSERMREPSRRSACFAPEILALEVGTDIRALGSNAVESLLSRPDRQGATRLMQEIYRSMPFSCAPVLKALVKVLDGPAAPGPLVIHCTAGKDRTGFVVAVLLQVLGVAPDVILANYLETNRWYDGKRQDRKIAALIHERFGVMLEPEALAAITCADRGYLAAAHAVVEQNYGSIANYLEQTAGLDAAMAARLRQALLIEAD